MNNMHKIFWKYASFDIGETYAYTTKIHPCSEYLSSCCVIWKRVIWFDCADARRLVILKYYRVIQYKQWEAYVKASGAYATAVFIHGDRTDLGVERRIPLVLTNRKRKVQKILRTGSKSPHLRSGLRKRRLINTACLQESGFTSGLT